MQTIPRSRLTAFYRLWPFVSFSQFINRSSFFFFFFLFFYGLLLPYTHSFFFPLLFFFFFFFVFFFFCRQNNFKISKLQINRSSCLRNSSYSFQGILMKLLRYCCYDLKIANILSRSCSTDFYQSYGSLTIFQQ